MKEKQKIDNLYEHLPCGKRTGTGSGCKLTEYLGSWVLLCGISRLPELVNNLQLLGYFHRVYKYIGTYHVKISASMLMEILIMLASRYYNDYIVINWFHVFTVCLVEPFISDVICVQTFHLHSGKSSLSGR